MMQIIQQSTKNQQHSRSIFNNSQLTQISIDRDQISLKQRIVEQLLSDSDVQNHRAILERWPSHQFRNKLQIGEQGFEIYRKSQNTRYYGQICNQMFHGYGLLIYQNQHQSSSVRFYQGDFQNNCKHGGGIQFINGDIYIGKYLNNKPEDHSAVFIWKNGDTFSGTFVNGMKHGHGRWVSGSDMYLGQWKFNKPDGQGIIKTPNSTYQGTVRNGYKHNSGTEIFSNGDRYNGSYANGKPEGQGTYYWNNGAIYKGQFKNGLRYGYGEWRYNAERYEGYYVNDKRNGHGLYTWQGGSFYKGEFQDDLRHGFGQMHWNQESYYAGNWREGAQDGQGQLWQFGKLVKKGIFQSGKLVKEHHQHNQHQHHENQVSSANHNTNERESRLHPVKNSQRQTFHKKAAITSNRYTLGQNKSKSPSQKEEPPTGYRKINGVKSSFSNQTRVTKIDQSESNKDRHLYNRKIQRHNPLINVPKHLYTPSEGNKSFFQSNYNSKVKIDKLAEKQNKANQSYNQQHIKRQLKPSVAKTPAIDQFSQTHLSPIKWNNFKNIRGQDYQENGKLPNIY